MMRLAVLTISFLFLLAGSEKSSAQLSNNSFWRNRASVLNFSTSAQSIYNGNCSGVVTIQTKNASNLAVNVGSNLSVALSTPMGITLFSDATCTTAIASPLTISIGTSSTSFYFTMTVNGAASFTATATGYIAATQIETITANPFVWTGGGGNTSWATGGNWSGGSAPGSGNTAFFDSTCSSNCSPTMAANTTVGGVRMEVGYAGTITQAAGKTLTVNSNNWVQLAGTFIGGDSAVIHNSHFYISAGTYTASSSTTSFAANYIVSGSPTINTGTSTYQFDSPVMRIGNETYNNVIIRGWNLAIALTGTLVVNGTLTFNAAARTHLNGGTVHAKGNIIMMGEAIDGTALVKVNGSADQSIDASGTATSSLPKFEIASTGGTVSLIGYINVRNDYTYTSGTISAGTSTLCFAPATNMTVAAGNVTYANLAFSVWSTGTFTFSGSPTVTGTLTLDSFMGGTILGGTFNLQGNLVLKNTGIIGTTTLVKMNGSSNQAIDDSASTSGYMPSLEIASTGGTVTLPTTFKVRGGFKYTQGTVAGATTANFYGEGGATSTIDVGSYVFSDVNFSGANGQTFNIVGTMSINGNAVFNSGNYAYITGGAFDIKGNLTNTTYYSVANAVTFSGTGTQTVSGNGIQTGTITVNKSSGSLVLGSNITWNYSGAQQFNLVAGTVNMSGKALTVGALSLNGNTITKGGGVLVVGGSSVGTGSLYGGTVAP